MLNLFLPIRIKNRFIISKTVLYIYIKSKSIYVCLVNISGSSRKVLKTAKVNFDTIDENNLDLFFANTINKMVGSWKFDYSKLIIISNNIIFKTSTFPFDDEKKIKMVAPFEIEENLPFSLSECVIDTISINSDKTKNINLALSAVVKQESLSFYKDIFSHTSLNLNSITVDAIEFIIYNLKKNTESDYFVFILDDESLLLLVYKNNLLVNIQNIQSSKIISKEYYNSSENTDKQNKSEETESKEVKPVETKEEAKLTEKVEEKVSEKPNEELLKIEDEHKYALTEINENSENKNVVENKIEKKVEVKSFVRENNSNSNLVNSIVSLIEIISKKNKINISSSVIYLVGFEKEKELTLNNVAKLLNCKIEKYAITEFDNENKNDVKIEFEDKTNNFFKDNETDILKMVLIDLEKSSSFNLAYEEDIKYKKNILFNQVIFGLIFSVIIIGISIITNLIKINNQNKKIHFIEQEYINFLKKEFSLQKKSLFSIDNSIKEAEKYNDEFNKKLPPIATENRFQFLSDFNDLSKHISKEIASLSIHEIKWKNDINSEYNNLVLIGEVLDFNSLHLLEEGLKSSNLFVNIKQAQDIKFIYNLAIFKHREKK